MKFENVSAQVSVKSRDAGGSAESASIESRALEAQAFGALLAERLNKDDQAGGDSGEEDGHAAFIAVDPGVMRDAPLPWPMAGIPGATVRATVTGETAGVHPGAVVVVMPTWPPGTAQPPAPVPDVQPPTAQPLMELMAQTPVPLVVAGVPEAVEPGLTWTAEALQATTATVASAPEAGPSGQAPAAPADAFITAPVEQETAPVVSGAIGEQDLEPTASASPLPITSTTSQAPVAGAPIDGQPASGPAPTATPVRHADIANAPVTDKTIPDLRGDASEAQLNDTALTAWAPHTPLAAPQGVPVPAATAPAAPVVPTTVLEADRYMAVQQTMQQGLSTLGTLGVASELQIQLNMANFVRTTLVIRREGGAVTLHCKSGSASERDWFRLNAKELGSRLRHATGLDVSLSVDEAA